MENWKLPPLPVLATIGYLLGLLALSAGVALKIALPNGLIVLGFGLLIAGVAALIAHTITCD